MARHGSQLRRGYAIRAALAAIEQVLVAGDNEVGAQCAREQVECGADRPRATDRRRQKRGVVLDGRDGKTAGQRRRGGDGEEGGGGKETKSGQSLQ